MKRLKSRGHADLIVLTPGAASELDLTVEEVLVENPYEVFHRFWSSRTTFLVIGAIGAVIRIIAPLLKGKDNDPSVLVIDGSGENIVPVLGGHKGGAEEFAAQLAQDIGGKAIFTGFSRTEKILSIDSFGKAWGWRRTRATPQDATDTRNKICSCGGPPAEAMYDVGAAGAQCSSCGLTRAQVW